MYDDRDDWYDVKQVCLNGHLITDFAASQPQGRKSFCPDCGERTIHACPKCGENMRGHRHMQGVFAVTMASVDKNCLGCGAPFPWTERRGAAVLEAADAVDGLSDQDKETLRELLPHLVNKTPRTDAAVLRVSKLVSKLEGLEKRILAQAIAAAADPAAKRALSLS